MQGIPPRAASPDYVPSSPSFIPPSPADPYSPLPDSPLPDIPDSPLPDSPLPDIPDSPLPDSPLPDIPDDVSTPNPPDHDGITTTEQVFIQLANHASLLDTYSDRIGRLEQTDQRVDRRIDVMDRGACVLFEDAIADRRERADLLARVEWLDRTHSQELWELGNRFRGLGRGQARAHNRMRGTERALEVTRDTIQAYGRRIASLESMLGAQLMINRENSRRLEQFEATQAELVAGMERLRLERTRD